MSLESLSSWLLQQPQFQARLDRLIVDSLRREFPAFEFSNAPVEYNWHYLLLCASLLGKVEDESAQKVALRIVEHCLNSQTDAAHRSASAVILDGMANQLAVMLAQKRGLLSMRFSDELPLPLKQDFVRRAMENMIVRAGGLTMPVNRFQKAFWQAVKTHQWVSVSAPTSAGKSFIIKTWIEDFVRTRANGKVVYLVPTRALIQEVQRDVEVHFVHLGMSHVVVHTLPSRGDIDLTKLNVFVFTQERFHLLLSATSPDFIFDILVVDEAQKIGDGGRGVLLQQVIDEALRRNTLLKLIFASPQTENPEYLLSDAAPTIQTSAVSRNTVTVTQNLLWVSQRSGKPKLWDVTYRDGTKALSLGHITLPFRPTPDSKRLSFIAFTMRSLTGGNIIYVNGPADAEKIADQLYGLMEGSAHYGEDPRIRQLIDLVQKTIHRDYTLAETLKRGIAYHYGNMPLLVRTEIERLFSENAIPFLVCTSTLMEGVNLPCRVIFARGPEKGRGHALEIQDFWNLAGRAGRWGKEFHGHIVCIDPTNENVWDSPAPTHRVKSRIRSATDKVLSMPEPFLAYIKTNFPSLTRTESPEFDYVFVYLASVFLRDRNLQAVGAVRILDKAKQVELEVTLADSLAMAGVPETLISRNPGILPACMQRLLTRFVEAADAVKSLVPVLPESQDAVAVYERILGVINDCLDARLGPPNRIKSLAILIVHWMRGYPLARLISERQRYAASRQANINLQQLIRSVMTDVEQFARFSAPKFLNCYKDMLKFHADKSSQPELVAELPDLGIYLEFGVSIPTQLSLIGLGLSRTSALTLSERIVQDNLDKAGVLRWLSQREWENFDMPELVKVEIRDVVRRHGSSAVTG